MNFPYESYQTLGQMSSPPVQGLEQWHESRADAKESASSRSQPGMACASRSQPLHRCIVNGHFHPQDFYTHTYIYIDMCAVGMFNIV